MITNNTDTDKLTFMHNGDFSGDVAIVFDPEAFDVEVQNFGGMVRATIKLPFEDIRNLVFSYLRMKEISKLEQYTNDEFEQYLTGDWK